MKLIEVFNQLSYGELSQLNLGRLDGEDINEDNYPVLMGHVNMGLTALYKRFSLKEGRLNLQIVPNQVSYPLLSKFAVTGKGTATVRYIKDSADAPFQEDIHKIERVITDTGGELLLNDYADPYSCHTPSLNILRLPTIVVDGTAPLDSIYNTKSVTLVYRANHPVIDINVGSFDPATRDIELPYSHLQALLYFVASRAHNPIGMTNEFNAGNNWNAKYEFECNQLESAGLEVDSGVHNTRLIRNGWC